MKIIDLLNKIAKGELEDKTKVKFGSEIYEFWEEDKKIHARSTITYEFHKNITRVLDWDKLDDEVEIIDEKNISKLEIKQNGNLNYYIENEYGTKCALTKHSKIIADKINELIDVINDMRDKE